MDKRVRHAVNLAIDRDKIIKVVFKGLAKKSGIPGVKWQGGYTEIAPYEYNPDKAQQLLKEAGYPDGFKDFVVVEDIVPKLGQALKSDLGKIGIDSKIVVEDENAEMQRIVMPRYDESLPRPGMGIFIYTCPDFGLYHTYFLTFITDHTDGPWSIMGDEQADELFDEAITTIDSVAAEQAWAKYHHYMRSHHFYLPILQRIVAYAAAKGLEFHPGEILDFTQTSWSIYNL